MNHQLSQSLRSCRQLPWRQRVGCVRRVLLPGAMAVAASGCAAFRDYHAQAAAFYQPYRRGRPAAAAAAAARLARVPGPDRALLLLEAGALHRFAGDFAVSNALFDQAERLVEERDQRAVVSARDLAAHAAAAVTNPAVRPYALPAHDRIMLNTYKALNYLALNRPEEARVELQRAYRRQQDAVAHHARDLRERPRETDDAQRAARDSPAVRRQTADLDRLLADLPAYADYVNPFTVYLDGVVHLATAADGSDLERARRDFTRVRGMIGPQRFLDADLRDVATRGAGRRPPPCVWVFVEDGLAPIRREQRIDVPVPGRAIVYAGAALPRLAPVPLPAPPLTVTVPGRPVLAPVLLAQMDAIIGREFRYRLPATITEALVAASAKGVAQYQAQREWGEVGQLAAVWLHTLTNHADVRSWKSLPKAIGVCRCRRPAAGTLRLHPDRDGPGTAVTLPDAEFCIVYVKRTRTDIVRVDTMKVR